MNRKFMFWDNPKQAVVFLVVMLIAIGAINIFSASYKDQVSSLFRNYIIFAGLGGAAAFVLQKLNYRIFLNKRFLIISYGIIFAMLLILFFAHKLPPQLNIFSSITVTMNGATRWFDFRIMRLQPSELAKILTILFGARYLGALLAKNLPVTLRNKNILGIFAVTCFNGLLVSQQPDWGTAAIIIGLLVGLLLVAGLPMLEFAFIALLGAIAVCFKYEDYHLERIKVWFDPWSKPLEEGYQAVQAQLTIGSGGLIGTKWGEGTFKFFHLPEAHTDFAFAVFCQENGFLGALVLITVFVVLGFALARIAVSTKNEKGFILVCGVSLFVIGQAAANMAMVCGVLPVIGVPMGFISYGGTSLVVNLIAIGLALSVYNDEVAQEKARSVLEPQERRSGLHVVSRRWHNDA